MSAFAPTVNGLDFTGLEWIEECAFASWDDDAGLDLAPPVPEPEVAVAVSLDGDILVVDVPRRQLQTHGRSLFEAISDAGLYSERYRHTVVDPDGICELGARFDIENTAASREAVAVWLETSGLDVAPVVSSAFSDTLPSPAAKP